MDCLGLALQAPNSCNAQRGQFVIVEGAAERAALAALYRRSYQEYKTGAFRAGNILTGDPAWDTAQFRIESSADFLAENLHRAPVMVIPCAQGRPEHLISRDAEAVLWGSIIPAAWSFCLAARSRGLGTVWTTLHLSFEQEAADIIGVPYPGTQQVALIPVAYTKGVVFKPGYRLPTQQVVTFRPGHQP
jgi:nitroreductase